MMRIRVVNHDVGFDQRRHVTESTTTSNHHSGVTALNKLTKSQRFTFQLDAACSRHVSTLPLSACLLLTLLGFSAATTFAQSERVETAPTTPLVTASIASDRARFVAPGASVVQIRLEVFSSWGEKLFDSEFRRGNLIDWSATANREKSAVQPDESVLFVVTVRTLSGQLRQRHGLASLQGGVQGSRLSLRRVAREELSPPQAQAWEMSRQTLALGPLVALEPDAREGFAILSEEAMAAEPQAATVTAHDGQDGQLTSTTGALTFRTGDLFSGKEVERMRITPEGNIGIGIDKPAATLDVAGSIRASGALRVAGGIEFSDGTVLTSAGKAGRPNASSQVNPAATGTGSQDRIAKWTDNAGTLGDSIITETPGGFLGIGTASPTSLVNIQGTVPSFLGHMAAIRTTGSNNGFGLVMDAIGDGNNNLGLAVGGVPKAAFSWDNSRAFLGFVNFNYSAFDFSLRVNSNGSLTFHDGLNSAERFRITAAGNVGVGTTNPTTMLDVAGNIKASGSLTSATANVVNQFIVDTSTLVVDAANNRVGVGTLAPAVPLDVVGDINTTTRYNIGGSRVLSNAGLRNLFAGVGAGAVNTAGDNSFFGNNAGAANTGGGTNSFFGSSAGAANTTAQGNSFFGADAGRSNIGGQNNSFFGLEAGESNTNGFYNAFFGVAAGAANTTANGNSFFGYAAGQANVTGTQNSFFGERAGAANTASGNSFFGSTAGNANDEGESNSFFGSNAGLANISGDSNSFFGANAGANTNTSHNSFFGKDAGLANTGGDSLSFFGKGAGAANTNGSLNSFFGTEAGLGNTTGEPNSFFGARAGYSNIGGDENSFFGFGAGYSNISGNSNTFVGINAGFSNTSEHSNTFLGASSNGAAGVTNATAIGANAVVTQSNSLVLGNGVKVGAGTSAPKEKLHVLGGNILIDGVATNNNGLILKSPDGLTCAKLTIDNAGALVTTVITCP
jgi:hypothetical protein